MSTLSLLTIVMGGVGSWVTEQIDTTIGKFESFILPEISTALSLSEGVAQIAALAPYVADSAKPYQLQGERLRLQQRLIELDRVAGDINNLDFGNELKKRLKKLLESLNELMSKVEEELFLREDILALQFDISSFISSLKEDEASYYTNNPSRLLLEKIISKLFMLTEVQSSYRVTFHAQLKEEIEQLSQYVPPAVINKVSDIVEKLHSGDQKINGIRLRKAFLVASIRAQSEELTNHVNSFVGMLQKDVSNQRNRVKDFVARGRFWMMLVSLLVAGGLLYTYMFTFRMTRDLETVSQEMTRLAEGNTGTGQISIQRNDEIGELASAFIVFRSDAIRMTEVSRKIAEQTKLLEAIFNQIEDGLSVFSRDQKLIAWNHRYLEIFDLLPSQIKMGMKLNELQLLMSREAHINLDIRHEQLDIHDINSARPFSAQTFERHYQNGKVIEFRSQPMIEGGFVTLYRDLTERRTIEGQLQHAQKMEVLGQLTGGVAHDFNNLLAAQLGSLQLMMLSPSLDPIQQRHLERALRVSEKGVILVQRLLAFSRKQKLHPEIIDTNDLIEGMLDLVEYSVGQNIQVRTRLTANKPLLLVDPSQLENALLNLGLNSSAAMPTGGTLTFLTKIDNRENQDYVAIQVIDTGTGIPDDIRDRVLEPFFTTKPIGKGSGLGLSMVYGFVKQSGGDMTIESRMGEGTKISLIMPLATNLDSNKYRSTNQKAMQFDLKEGESILLLEDDPDVSESIAGLIKQLGFNCSHFNRAETALEQLISGSVQPQLVLSDVNLRGEMSGVELIRKLAINKIYIPIVLTSGLPRETLQQKYSLKPSDPFLQKPISLDMLRQLVRGD